MARTRRWSDVAQEALRLFKLRMSEREIAAHLGVAKSTVTRWKRDGKLPRLVVDNTTDQDAAPVSASQSPAEWAQAMRAEYQLDPSDDQLVTAGEIALTIMHDLSAKRSERLNAMGRFGQVHGKLQLVIRNMRAAEAMQQQPAQIAVNAPAVVKKPRATRRPSTDPRILVMK